MKTQFENRARESVRESVCPSLRAVKTCAGNSVRILARTLAIALATAAAAHDLTGDPTHPHYDWSVRPPETAAVPPRFLAPAETQHNPGLSTNVASTTNQPLAAVPFRAFAPHVKVRWDDTFFYVESDGMPVHPMMVGITAWQQQVPLPQSYFGDNAWRFPLNPLPARQPQSIKNNFLRGAIAIAVNGIPIFNPQNNRGEISAEIGELDKFGGHAGRADDYHYHAAPLHLQKYVGLNNPIAFALDGYPIYGLTEPDGLTPVNLDAFDGHSTPQLGYHYHASNHYPYVNGGFHGTVTERDGQVDPQPRAQPVRPATTPLRGAVITDFKAEADGKSYTLTYALNGQPVKLHYAAESGAVRFDFTDASGKTATKNYPTHLRSERGENPPPQNDFAGQRPPRDGGGGRGANATAEVQPTFAPKHTGLMTLTSSAVTNGSALPVEFTGDGAGISPPLNWSGAPAGTKFYAVIMHHVPGPGAVKWYWTLYNLPATVTSLPKNAQGIGTSGNNSVNRNLGYAPPHSKGPGVKNYFLTVYALSSAIELNVPPQQVSRAVLLNAMQDKILDSAELKVTYDRTGAIGREPGDQERPPR